MIKIMRDHHEYLNSELWPADRLMYLDADLFDSICHAWLDEQGSMEFKLSRYSDEMERIARGDG